MCQENVAYILKKDDTNWYVWIETYLKFQY